ncbi:helix-turn-helix domain-containing protein [Dyadobacter sp. CY356]|uniref:helix-turn-helix domain-containing protein n=1 Tax=Dyadobacter sp. CY356 TaxID=2906442 RepID=UPI001F1BF004|nr:helix-turn-helix transcriptional regulator [Dyadobacter sp. CY356]MCF0055086.1 helix-turn-helix domain-containing protein [Dyadobacter sp. CY356]
MAEESQEELEKLGKRIKQLRKFRNLTQVDLEILSGINNGDISRIEHGKNIALTSLFKLAYALKIKTKEFFDYDGPLPVD